MDETATIDFSLMATGADIGTTALIEADGDGNVTQSIGIEISEGTITIGGITLTATPTPPITVGGTTNITATVTDTSTAIAPNGTIVTFEEITVLGNFSGGTSINDTTTGGVATAIFTADTDGTATIAVTAGDVTETINIMINAAP
jgi:hypothetical protein